MAELCAWYASTTPEMRTVKGAEIVKQQLQLDKELQGKPEAAAGVEMRGLAQA